MSETDDRVLDGAALADGEDVLVLGGGPLVFGAHDRIGDGWVYVVRAQVDELEELLGEAHGSGAAGVAYLVGEAPVLPLPDEAVAAAIGWVAVAAGSVGEAARELRRVLRPAGRLSLAVAGPLVAAALEASLTDAGFLDVAVESAGEEALVTARRA